MKNVKVKIGEREIPMLFWMPEFLEIEETVGNLGEIRNLILNGKQRLRNMITVTRILGNAGLKAAGEIPDLTDEWLMENMDPHKLMQYQLAVLACMSDDSKSEAAQEESEEKDRDLVLEEIEQKKELVNSRTGE